MSLKLRKFVKKQSEEDKKMVAQILNNTYLMLKQGRTDTVFKYLAHNKRKIEMKPKKGLFESILKRFR